MSSKVDERASIGRSAGKIGIATFISHLFGMARDVLFAALFGTSLFADAFNLSFSIPTFLRRVFGEAVMNAAFVPVFTQYREKHDTEEVSRFASNVFLVLGAVLLAATALAVAAAPLIVKVYAQGWAGEPERLAVAVRLTRILFPYVFFVGLAVLVMGMLNAVRHFTVPALSPVVFNVGIIAAALIALRFEPRGTLRIDIFCVGVVAGSLGQLLIQLPMLPRRGIRFLPHVDLRSRELHAIGRLMIPGVIGLAVVQVNSLVDTMFATFLPEGSVTALRLGNRVMLLPLAIFATAVASASLPSLSAQVANEGIEKAKETLHYTLRFLFFFLVPASAGLMILSRPVIRLLFVRGAFDAGRSLDFTSAALLLYSAGLLAFGGIKAMAQIFFSVRDTRTPMVVGAAAMLCNILFNFILYRPLQVAGLALATSLAGFVNISFLYVIFVRRYGSLGAGLFASLGRIVLAALVMAVPAVWLSRLLEPAPGAETLAAQLVHVGVTIAAGAVAYLAAAFFLCRRELDDVAQALLHRPLPPGR